MDKPQPVLEKGYALSYLLVGIAAVSALRESLVFKGGISLRKVYFPGYRFSEGLTRRNGRRRAATHFRGGCVVIYEAFTTQPPYRRSRRRTSSMKLNTSSANLCRPRSGTRYSPGSSCRFSAIVCE